MANKELNNKKNKNNNEENLNSKTINLTDKKEFYWRAPEYNLKKRDLDWYVSISLISLVLIIIAIFQKNFLFIVFILLALFFLIYSSKRKPRILDFKINEEGIDLGQELFFKYEDLDGFSFYEKYDSLDELVLKSKKGLVSYFFIPIDKISKEKVREILKEKIPEFEYSPSLIDLLFEKYF